MEIETEIKVEMKMEIEMEMEKNPDFICWRRVGETLSLANEIQILKSIRFLLVTHFSLSFSGRLKCYCGRRFKHLFSLVCHQRGECGQGYQCKNCSFKTDKLYLWSRHVKSSNCKH